MSWIDHVCAPVEDGEARFISQRASIELTGVEIHGDGRLVALFVGPDVLFFERAWWQRERVPLPIAVWVRAKVEGADPQTRVCFHLAERAR